MCEENSVFELIFVLTIIFGFIAFVIGINWWNIKDAKKMLDRIYPLGNIHD